MGPGGIFDIRSLSASRRSEMQCLRISQTRMIPEDITVAELFAKDQKNNENNHKASDVRGNKLAQFCPYQMYFLNNQTQNIELRFLFELCPQKAEREEIGTVTVAGENLSPERIMQFIIWARQPGVFPRLIQNDF